MIATLSCFAALVTAAPIGVVPQPVPMATALPMTATPGAPTPPSLPTAAPTAAPTVVPATPSPLPFKYRFIPRSAIHPKPGQPQIYAVYLNDKNLHSLGPIRIRVETTADVVKVVSRSNGRDGVIPLVSPGTFEASSTLPKIPFIAAGMTLDLEFIATTADGRKSVVRVPVRLG